MSRGYTKHSDDSIREAVKVSVSWGGVCRFFGVNITGGSQAHLKKRALKIGINFDHFPGQAHNKGKVLGPKRKVEEYLIAQSTSNSHSLKLRLVKEGIKEYRCEICGIDEWLSEELPLDLDHINRDHSDCRLENLQILCPNCHAQKTRKDRQAGVSQLEEENSGSSNLLTGTNERKRSGKSIRCV